MTTTMAAAFAKAGRKGPQARLEDHAIEAWNDALSDIKPDPLPDASEGRKQLEESAAMALEQNPMNFKAALGLFLGSLSQDAGALNALIGGDKVRVMAGEYLHKQWLEHFGSKDVEVKAHERGSPSKDGGHSTIETHEQHAAGGGDRLVPEIQGAPVPAAVSHSRRAAALVASGIFGRSIGSGTRRVGDVTRFDVLQIKRRGVIDTAVADGLLDLNWPDDHTPVSKFATEADVEAVFQRAYRAFDAMFGKGGAEIENV